MSAHVLNVSKLAEAVEHRRGAGKPGEISYLAVARQVGMHPSMLTRLREGRAPRADGLIALLMWLDPQAAVADYAVLSQPPQE